MAAISTSADGNYIFLALENGSGQPVIAKCARSNLSAFSAAYNPAAGTVANVAQVPSEPDKMLFYGHSGTDVQVIEHAIAAGSNTNVSPASLAAKVVNCLEANPSDSDEWWLTIATDQDAFRTTDGGTNYTSLDTTLGFDPTALEVLWSGAYNLDRAFVAGKPVSVQLQYTPNELAAKADEASAALAATANICSIETTEVVA